MAVAQVQHMDMDYRCARTNTGRCPRWTTQLNTSRCCSKVSCRRDCESETKDTSEAQKRPDCDCLFDGNSNNTSISTRTTSTGWTRGSTVHIWTTRLPRCGSVARDWAWPLSRLHHHRAIKFKLQELDKKFKIKLQLLLSKALNLEVWRDETGL